MNKHILGQDDSIELIKRLTADTKEGKLVWEEKELDENVEVLEKFEIPLTTARRDYHYVGIIEDDVEVHLQSQGERYYIWLIDESEMALIEDKLYKIPLVVQYVIELAKAVYATRSSGLKAKITHYLGK